MDAQLVRRGAERARVGLRGTRREVGVELEVTLGLHEPKRVRLNGSSLPSAESLRSELATLVFTPDRLSVVKGGPAVRRAYVDRALGRLLPARADVPLRYGAALGQRNALLRRAAATGETDRDALAPWTQQVSQLASELVAARDAAIGLLASGFASAAAELGLEDARLAYSGDAVTAAALDARLARDVARGSTGRGPHLDEIAVLAGERDLRAFGSQGEQRIAVLALLLAEAELLAGERAAPPLVLLDDVLSELDGSRRRSLAQRVGRLPQAIVTATGAESLPVEPAQALLVTAGRVEAAA
jgi:DNA replication and repair protein RecF